MNIAFFTDTYLPTVDGVVTALCTTKRQLEALGHRVLVVAPARKGVPREPGTRYVWALRFKRYPEYGMALVPTRDADALQEFDADLVHSHGLTFMAVKAMWAAWQLDLPTVQTWHTMIHEAIPYYSPFALDPRVLERGLRVFLRRYLRKCDEVIAPTGVVMKELLELAPNIRRHRVLPTGVDTARFRPGIDGSWVRERWGVDGGRLVLHVGRISPEKNLPVLFAAMAAVRREAPDARLVIAGTGPKLEEYRAIVRQMGLAETVQFAGFVPDAELPAYYAACDAFATASTFETQGLVILEAMASGKPVAGPDFRAVPEFVREGVNGHLFAANDPVAAAGAILKCLRGDIAAGACRETAERFSVVQCTGLLVDAYRELLRDWGSGAMPHGTGRIFG